LFYVCTAHQTVMKGQIRVIPSLSAPIIPRAQEGNANQVAYTSNTGSYSLASNSAITRAIHVESTVCISINGIRRLLSDSNTSPFFFSRNGGSTQLLLAQVKAGDSLYVRPAYLEHGLETSDIILLEYFSGGTVNLASPVGTYYWTNGDPFNNLYTYVPIGTGPPNTLTGFSFNATAKDSNGVSTGNIMTYLNARAIGSTISGFDTTSPSTNYGTWTITSKQQFGQDLIQFGVSYVSGTGTLVLPVEWAFTFAP